MDVTYYNDRTTQQQNINEELQALSKQMAEFVVLQEAQMEKLLATEQERERQFFQYRDELHQQLHNVQQMMSEFSDIMTHAGAARWRMAAEQSLREGQNHAAVIQAHSEHFKTLVEQSVERIEKASQQAEKRLSTVVRSLRLSYFKHLIERGCAQVEQVSAQAINQVARTVKWFHWERLAVALMVALIVAFGMAFYLNAEWPWETHDKAIAERHAGQVLLHVWPHLSQTERDSINQIAGVDVPS